jgi:spermidine/putrescine transport system permease protein
MTQRTWRGIAGALYLASFLAFLFAPFLLMGVTAFNSTRYPQAVPFESFTLHWFVTLTEDTELIDGLRTSLVIAAAVAFLSVVLGLAGALLLRQLSFRAQRLFAGLAVLPILTPGVVIGISSVIFWRTLARSAGLDFAYNGTFITILAQSSFIASYCMLIINSRLDNLDPAIEEAALDLGASRWQVFRQILLPFLRPAVWTGAGLAFLSSIENYNVTTFSILADKTFITVLASRVRLGISPAISAMAVLIIAIMVLLIAVSEGLRKAKRRHAAV